MVYWDPGAHRLVKNNAITPSSRFGPKHCGGARPLLATWREASDGVRR